MAGWISVESPVVLEFGRLRTTLLRRWIDVIDADWTSQQRRAPSGWDKKTKNMSRQLLFCMHWHVFNPLTAGVAYIRVFIFYEHIKYHLLSMW